MKLTPYARVSTDDQKRNGRSLEQQPARLAAYCALHNHTMDALIVDDGVSAGKPLASRKGGAELIRRLRAGESDGVVVVHLDRLFRLASDGFLFFDVQVDRQGVSVHSVNQSIDTSTPGGWLAMAMTLVASEYDRRMDIARGIECNAALRSQGRVYGHVPYGCVAVGEGEARRLMRDQATWPTRDRIVSNLRSGMSLRAAAGELAMFDIPSPTGRRRWSPNTLRELRTHHDSLASLPVADVAHLATPSRATPDPGVSAHV